MESERHEAVFQAAMHLAEQGRWRSCSPADIAALAGIDSLDPELGDRMSILRSFARAIDSTVSERAAGTLDDADVPVREKLLELLLLRFEALVPYRSGVAALLRGLPLNPDQAARGLPFLTRSMRQSLEQCGINASGLRGTARIGALSLIFLDAARVWARDTSEDLAATTRHLDERLRRAENLELRLARPDWCGRRSSG